MRLNCPNCGAQYEVPIDVIPTEGRDVQCSSCGITWFQAHPDHAGEPDLDLDIPAAQEEWTPVAETAETEPVAEPEADLATETDTGSEASNTDLQEAVKEAVRVQMPEEVDQVIAQEVEDKIDDSPLGDFEAELDAQLASGDDLTWSSEPEAPAAAEEEPVYVDSDAIQEPEAPEEADALFAPAPPEAAPARARRRREVDPAVADILREEANHEAEVRRAEESSIETQQEFGLETHEEDEISRRANQARARMARMQGLSEEPPLSTDNDPEVGASRRNLLPDIEEINSTLRATDDRAPEEMPDGRPPQSQRRRGGSRLGFGLALLLIAGLMFVYARPGVITAQIPQSAPAVSGYVTFVDDGRIWLDVQMTKLMLWLDGMASEDTPVDS